MKRVSGVVTGYSARSEPLYEDDWFDLGTPAISFEYSGPIDLWLHVYDGGAAGPIDVYYDYLKTWTPLEYTTVKRVGDVVSETNSNQTGSFNITIPESANICLMSISGFLDTVDFMDYINFIDSTSMVFTLIDTALYQGKPVHQVYYITQSDPNWPGSGDQTIYWGAEDPVTEGLNMAVFFYKNVDIDYPIVDSEHGSSITSNMEDVTSSMIASLGDMGILSMYDQDNTPNVGAYWQTELINSLFNHAQLAISEELGEGRMRFWQGVMGLHVAFILRVVDNRVAWNQGAGNMQDGLVNEGFGGFGLGWG
jgi:hypothetical protein